jgi:hypothetical protein
VIHAELPRTVSRQLAPLAWRDRPPFAGEPVLTLCTPPRAPERGRGYGLVLISKQMRTYTNKAEGRSAERFFGRGEGILLALKMTTILVLAALILAAPAVAQESPADAGEANAGPQQYRVHSSEALADGIRDASDTAGRGADAVNDASTTPLRTLVPRRSYRFLGRQGVRAYRAPRDWRSSAPGGGLPPCGCGLASPAAAPTPSTHRHPTAEVVFPGSNIAGTV